MNWWAIAGYVIAIASFGFAVRNESRRRKERLHRQQRFEWEHVTQGVRQLCKQIRSSGFEPDFLIGIPGAGMILIELSVIELGEDIPIYNVQQKHSGTSGQFFGAGVEVQTAKWRYWIPSEILQQTDRRVLLLDDYAQSGDTLFGLRAALMEKGFAPEKICTA